MSWFCPLLSTSVASISVQATTLAPVFITASLLMTTFPLLPLPFIFLNTNKNDCLNKYLFLVLKSPKASRCTYKYFIKSLMWPPGFAWGTLGFLSKLICDLFILAHGTLGAPVWKGTFLENKIWRDERRLGYEGKWNSGDTVWAAESSCALTMALSYWANRSLLLFFKNYGQVDLNLLHLQQNIPQFLETQSRGKSDL